MLLGDFDSAVLTGSTGGTCRSSGVGWSRTCRSSGICQGTCRSSGVGWSRTCRSSGICRGTCRSSGIGWGTCRSSGVGWSRTCRGSRICQGTCRSSGVGWSRTCRSSGICRGEHVAVAGSGGGEHVAIAGSGMARRDRRWFRAVARCRSETGAPLLHAVRRYADVRPSGPRCGSKGTARVAGQRAVVRFGTQGWCGPHVGMARRDRRWFRAVARCRSETGTPPPLSPRGSAVRGCAALRAAVPVGGRRSRARAPPCRPGGRRALPGRPYRAPFRTRVRAAVGSGVSLPPHRLTQAGPGTPLRRRRRSGGRPGHRPPPGDAFPLSLRPRSPRPPWARR